eukprot:gene1661-1691_t
MAAKALAFDVGDYVVYPKHGVGRVVELQNEEIAGMKLELYVLRFEKERMTLRVPVNKVEAIGMRKLSSDKTLREALDTLKGKPKVKRTMWSRRAQEYEAKINSGDLVSIAEVTRDLFRADDQPEQSYSERQIFEAASSRLARELAAMEKTDEPAALKKILANKTGRRHSGGPFCVVRHALRPPFSTNRAELGQVACLWTNPGMEIRPQRGYQWITVAAELRRMSPSERAMASLSVSPLHRLSNRVSPGLLAPLALLALIPGGCDAPKMAIDGHVGVPFAQIDLTNQKVRAVTLLGSDTVHIVHGDRLAIKVEGDAAAKAALRFVLGDGKLGIGRDPLAGPGTGAATVTVTTPMIDQLNMAGSGTMSSDRLTGNAVGVTIGGSGHVVTARIETARLDLSVMGSGSFTGSGHAGKLDLSLAGSGEVDLAQLKADEAAIDVAGSGTADLASDGPVTGTVAGSGTITVHGKAHCD